MCKIDRVIKSKERNWFVFTPNQDFYERVKIGRKRWAQLRRGEADPTLAELTAIAEFFNVEINELI